MPEPDLPAVRDYLLDLQDRIGAALAEELLQPPGLACRRLRVYRTMVRRQFHPQFNPLQPNFL